MSKIHTMCLVFSPDGKQSGKYRDNKIPEGWLRTHPDEQAKEDEEARAKAGLSPDKVEPAENPVEPSTSRADPLSPEEEAELAGLQKELDQMETDELDQLTDPDVGHAGSGEDQGNAFREAGSGGGGGGSDVETPQDAGNPDTPPEPATGQE